MNKQSILVTLVAMTVWVSPLLFCRENPENLVKENRGIEIDTSENIRARTVKYIIDARFFPDKDELLGTETVTLINKSQKPADHIDLYTFGRPGYMEVTALRRISASIPAGKISHAPVPTSKGQSWPVTRVTLEPALAPYGAITLEIGFKLKIPPLGKGLGRIGDYYFMSDWFPRPADPENPELREYGDYKVGITLPGNFIIGGSGRMENVEKKKNGRTTYLFEGENILDFAWTASPSFKEFIRKTRLSGNSRDTEIALLLSPRREQAAGRYFLALEGGLHFLAENLAPYPYPRITVVAPPLHALQAGGRAFPALIVAADVPYIGDWINLTEMWTLRNLARQFWQGMAGDHDPLVPVMEEGIITFLEMDMLEHVFKNRGSFARTGFIELACWEMLRLNYLLSPPALNMVWPNLGKEGSRIALLLASLENYLGREKLFDFFRFYLKKYRHRHHSREDFMNAFSDYMGEDFSWAFNQFVKGNRTVDHGVEAITSTPIPGQPGKFRNQAVFVRRGGYFPVALVVGLKNGQMTKSFWKEMGQSKKMVTIDDSPIQYAAIDPDYHVLLDINFLDNRKTTARNIRGTGGLAVKLAFLVQNVLGFLSL